MNDSPHIVFMGSPDFAVPPLQALATNFQVVGVVTQPDRPAGRGGSLHPPAVKLAAQRLGLPIIQPEKLSLPEIFTQLEAWAPDLIVVAAFGQILRQSVLNLPTLGCINIHASLLPRGRGAAPIQAAILAGDSETGITIMKMDAGVDTGPIISQRRIPILPEDTGGTLFNKLAPIGAGLLIDTLPGYISGRIAPHPQPELGITYAPMLKKEDGLLQFGQPGLELERRVRALNPWPGTYFEWQGQPLKVHKAHLIRDPQIPLSAFGKRLVYDGSPRFILGMPPCWSWMRYNPQGRNQCPAGHFSLERAAG